MSLFLRFASIKCPGRTIIPCIKRFYWTSHGCTFREGLGIRYFLPRTADTADIQTEQVKNRDSVPEDFKVIYNFSHEEALSAVSFSALGFAAILIFFLINPKYLMELNEQEKEQQNEPVSEEPILKDEYTSSVTVQKITTLLDSALQSEVFYSGDPRAKSLIGLSMIVFFFYIRSRFVLTIYRHNDNFVTVFYHAFGFGKKLVKHRANDCCYYPKKKWFNYNVMGRDVIIFPELFVNFEERQLYIGRSSQ